MKQFYIAILFIFNIISIFAQSIQKDELPELYRYDENQKYGFINLSGDIIIPPIYSESHIRDYNEFYAGPDSPEEGVFTCGLARVHDERGYGYVDYRGVEIIPCQYKWALPFNNGLAAVCGDDGKWGYIDTTGKVIVPLKYYLATMHRDGVAFIAKQKASNSSDELCALVDNHGNIITDFIYKGIIGWPFFSEGIKVVSTKDNKKIAIDTKGRKLFECPNMNYHYFYSEGLISCSRPNEYYNDKLMDRTGKIVLNSQYSEIRPFQNGVTLVLSKNGYGAINKQFKEIIPSIYPEVYVNDNIFLVKNASEKYGFFNINGKEIIPFKFEGANCFHNGLAGVKYNGKYGFIDVNGNFIIPAIYDRISNFEESGYAIVQRGNMYSVIDMEQTPLAPYTPSVDVAWANLKKLGTINAKSDVDIHIPRTSSISNNTLVLIIANEKYSTPKVGNVQYAKNDGKGMKSYCNQALGIPEQNIMVCEDATLSQIKAGLNWLIQKSHISEYGKAIVYYAGHGVPDYSTTKSYILPSDGNPSDITTSLSLDEFYNQLSSVKVQQCITLVDACFSGANRRGEAINEVRGIMIKAKEPEIKGKLIVLSASQGDETAQPYPNKHHGMFTYYLLKYLQQNKGNAKIMDLYNYLKVNVSSTALDISGKGQTPSILYPAEMSYEIKGASLN
jgi:hypothetical protein